MSAAALLEPVCVWNEAAAVTVPGIQHALSKANLCAGRFLLKSKVWSLRLSHLGFFFFNFQNLGAKDLLEESWDLPAD